MGPTDSNAMWGVAPNLHFPHLHQTLIYTHPTFTPDPNLHKPRFTPDPNLHKPRFTQTHFWTYISKNPNLHNPNLHKTQIYTTQIYTNPNLHYRKVKKTRPSETQPARRSQQRSNGYLRPFRPGSNVARTLELSPM